MWRRVATPVCMVVLWISAVAAQPPAWPVRQPPSSVAPMDADQLAREVTIYRDQHGIPHIVGKTDESTYFGFGYASAEDHLEKILVNYRRGAGRMAENGGDRYLLSDFHARLFRLRRMAVERNYEIDPELRTVLDAYAAGINHFMDKHPAKVPNGGEHVVPADIVGFHRYLTLFEFVLARYGVFGPPKPLPTGVLLGLAPSRSNERLPTLLATFQSEWAGPLGLYEARLSSGEGANVYGATFPGLPAIFMGCNANIAWGFTPNAPDLSDTHILKMRSFTPPMYSYMNGAYRMWVEPAQIGVKVPGGGVRPVPRQLFYAHNGPVVDMANNVARVTRVAGWRDLNGLRQWLLVNRADSVGEFKRAISATQVPSLNAVCIDNKGDTFYAYCAKGQRKLETLNWRQPVDGGRTETEWRGFMPFGSVPQVTNPESGFVQIANGLPWRSAAEFSPEPGDYPSYLVEDERSLRSNRILNVLQEEPSLSLSRVKELAYDVTVPFAKPAVQMLVAANQTRWRQVEDASGQMMSAVYILQNWDGRVNADSKGAALFDEWWRQYRMAFLKETESTLVEQLDRPGARQSETGIKALRMAINVLIARYGRIDVPWSAVRRMRRGGLDLPAEGTANLHTIHQADPEIAGSLGSSVVGRGDAFKMIVQMGSSPKINSIVPLGNSSAPKSAHLADQMKLYSARGFKDIDFENGVKGRRMVSARGVEAMFETGAGGATLEFTADDPVTVRMRTLNELNISPPVPKTARLAGPPVRLYVTPPATKNEWTLTVPAPAELEKLLDKDYVPVCLVETSPNRWWPTAAKLTSDKTGIVVKGSGPCTLAVYLVVGN